MSEKITLIVCTRNRANQLGQTLKSLGDLKAREPWSIVIVNNGSTDRTQTLLDEFAVQNPHRVRVVQEPRIGVSYALNAGIKNSTGSLIALCDDDCYPEMNYLDQVRACFEEGSIDYLGGRVLLFDPNDAAITIQIRTTRLNFPPYCYTPPGAIHGCAMAFRRSAIESIGGFDTDLGPGSGMNSGNDINVLIRFSALGMLGAYDPRPVVRHHHRRRDGSDVKNLMHRYDVSRGTAFWLGLRTATTRSAYIWPTLRRIFSNLLKGNWGTMYREISGAYRYARILALRSH